MPESANTAVTLVGVLGHDMGIGFTAYQYETDGAPPFQIRDETASNLHQTVSPTFVGTVIVRRASSFHCHEFQAE